MLFRAVLLACLGGACAQIGEGWNQYWPQKKIHLDNAAGLQIYEWTPQKSVGCADYSYDQATGIETFRLLQTCTNRSEIRFVNDYTKGKRQFEGEVRFTAPTDDESVMQVWGGNGSGATTQMIRAMNDAGGRLIKNPGGEPLIDGVYATWIKVNVIHDVSANTVVTYINGVEKTTTPGQAPSSWYHKYGCYGTLRTGTAKVEWRNVKEFTTEKVEGSGILVLQARHGTLERGEFFDVAGRRFKPRERKLFFDPGLMPPFSM